MILFRFIQIFEYICCRKGGHLQGPKSATGSCLLSVWEITFILLLFTCQGDQNLHWDLAHQQGQLHHGYQQGPI